MDCLVQILSSIKGDVEIKDIEWKDGVFTSGSSPRVIFRFASKIHYLNFNFTFEKGYPIQLYIGEEIIGQPYVTFYNLYKEYTSVYFEKEIDTVTFILGSNEVYKGIVGVEAYERLPNTLKLPYVSKNKGGEKILFISHIMDGSGAPRLLEHVLKAVKHKEIAVLTLGDGYLMDVLRKENIPVYMIHPQSNLETITYPIYFETLLRTFYTLGYRKVITNTIISGITLPYIKKFSFKVLSLVHEMQNAIETYHMKGGKEITELSDFVVFPNEVVRDSFMRVYPDIRGEICIRPQGMYLEIPHFSRIDRKKILEKYGIPSFSYVIMCSGSPSLVKGYDFFFTLADLIIGMEKDREYHFVWAGPMQFPELGSWLHFQEKNSRLKGRIHHIPYIKNKMEYLSLLKTIDLFWLPSREDSNPSVVLEAMGIGKCTVAFHRSGGAESLLADGRGVLIEPYQLYDFALESIKICIDKERRNKIEKKAEKYISKNLDFKEYVKYLLHKLK